LWTTPAWLAWYLYATSGKNTAHSGAAEVAEPRSENINF
jgi:hypothetical protein